MNCRGDGERRDGKRQTTKGSNWSQRERKVVMNLVKNGRGGKVCNFLLIFRCDLVFFLIKTHLIIPWYLSTSGTGQNSDKLSDRAELRSNMCSPHILC